MINPTGLPSVKEAMEQMKKEEEEEFQDFSDEMKQQVDEGIERDEFEEDEDSDLPHLIKPKGNDSYPLVSRVSVEKWNN